MHYLVDPSQVHVGPFAWLFLAVLCVAMPVLVVRQHRGLQSGAMPAPSRHEVYASAIVTHVILLLAVWAVAHSARLDLLPFYELRSRDAVIGLVALASGLPLLSERFGQPDPIARERTRLIAPRTPGDHALFYSMSLTAGVSEELAYRGALFVLLAALTGGWWLAALLSAVAFGLVHVFQGWRSAGIVTLVGLRDQVVVGLTGTLAIVVIVHVVHNVIAGTILGIRARRERSALLTHHA